jgi:hypothetical protein
MFPLAFVDTSQDWLILQISLASLKVAHMASHWRMTVDAANFNTQSVTGLDMRVVPVFLLPSKRSFDHLIFTTKKDKILFLIHYCLFPFYLDLSSN